jgi:RNA polymerase sigma-70 factor (ECF subfamily)
LFRGEYPGIVRVLAPIVGSMADAEALAQDAFVKAYTRWRRVGAYDRPGAWIRRVAIRDAVRFATRHRRDTAADEIGTDPTRGVAANLDLERALLGLSPNQRACIVLYHLADWPVADVAEALGCAEATVRVHLHRGRQALAAALTTETEEVTDGR